MWDKNIIKKMFIISFGICIILFILDIICPFLMPYLSYYKVTFMTFAMHRFLQFFSLITIIWLGILYVKLAKEKHKKIWIYLGILIILNGIIELSLFKIIDYNFQNFQNKYQSFAKTLLEANNYDLNKIYYKNDLNFRVSEDLSKYDDTSYIVKFKDEMYICLSDSLYTNSMIKGKSNDLEFKHESLRYEDKYQCQFTLDADMVLDYIKTAYDNIDLESLKIINQVDETVSVEFKLNDKLKKVNVSLKDGQLVITDNV